MAQATLNAAVVLGGRVDNSFTQVGDALLNMSMTVDQISQKLINFGKDSINVYRGYQDSMLDAEVALSTTYGRGTRELKAVMMELDAQATEWAASTIFHTDDVANAISEAAHANWDLDKILTGMPAAMRLAQAGGMDLSEALNYIVKTSNAANIAFEDMPGFIDEWIFASNSSAGTARTFGDAMLRMGATMRYTGSQEELLTLLAALHDAGAEGAEAGTLLRNSLIRLLAPTDKAATAMAFLGVSEEEVNAAMAETKGNAKKAAQMLKGLGFSAYDQKGNLKNFTDIFTDLALTVDKMSEQDKNEVLSAIFPTRTITGALTMLEAAKNNWNGLLEALQGGDAAGYGKYGAEKMMSGLTGSIETFNSKLERLKQLTGEKLEGDVTDFLSMAGDFIDKIATMDERSFTGLVGGLEGIAATGPALAAAGWGFRFLGQMLGTHTGRIALAATALFAFGKAMNDLAQYDYEQSFGDLSLDSEQIQAYLNGVKQPFIDARKDLDAYKESMEAAVKAYTETSSQLAQGIITKMVTGTTLTDEEKNSFQKMGEEMIANLRLGISNSYETTNQSLLNTFGGFDEAVDNPLFQDINTLMQMGYADATAKAESLSQQLRSAMTSAFADGQLTGDEVANIQSVMDEMNQLLAIQTNAAMYAQEERLMRRAQTLGIDGLEQLQAEVDAAQSEVMNQMYSDHARDYGQTRAYLEYMRGRKIKGKLVDDNYIKDTIQGLRETQKKQEIEAIAEFSKIKIRAFDNALFSSENADAARRYEAMAKAASSGNIDPDMLFDYLMVNPLGLTHRDTKVEKFLNDAINSLGGTDTVRALIDQYDNVQDYDTAGTLQNLLNMQQIPHIRNHAVTTNKYSGDEYVAEYQKVDSFVKGLESSAEEAKEKIDETLNPQEITTEYPDAVETAKAVHDEIAAEFPPIYQEIITTQTGGASQSTGGEKSGGGFFSNLWNGAKSLLGFAEGGRSDVPAIFGEGPTPEWAIPEAHTPRTASLLAAAADASGFSWGELASAASSRGGGGSSGGDGIVVHYSPVIHSDNMDGIDHILREDKERLRREIEHLLDERRMYESVVAYT